MKTVLLLITLSAQLLGFSVFSQNPDQIYPFEDYRKCYTGFRTYSGDIVHEAEFETAYPIYGSNRDKLEFCWVVEEMGRYGILNWKGEYIVPSQLDTVFHNGRRSFDIFKQDWLITASNGKYGMIDFSGNEILPPTYREILPYQSWLRVRNSDGKVGLLDSSLQVDVPLEFEELQFQNYYDFSLDTLVFYPYFHAKKNGHFALLRRDLTPILPYEYEQFSIRGLREDYILRKPYIVATKEGKKGLYSHDGKLVIPHEFESIQLNSMRNRFYPDKITTAIGYNNKKGQTFFNIETGARSKEYDQIRLYGGKAIAQNKRGKWWVLHSNGTEMGSGSKEWYVNEETLDLRDSIVVISRRVASKKRPSQEVLYHCGSGKMSSASSWIFRVDHGDEHYCWSTTHDSIIIYDSQLQKVKTIKGRLTEVMENLEENDIPYILPVQIVKNGRHGLQGGYDARGKEVIPRKYTEIEVVTKTESHKRWKYISVPDYFRCKNDSSMAYYSLTGELIRELNFTEIYGITTELYAAENGDYISLLDRDYNVVLDSCLKAFQGHSLKSDWSNDFTSQSTNNTYRAYIIRNQKYLMQVDGNFVPMDSTRFEFKNDLQFKFDVLIDKTGSVVSPVGASLRKIGSYYIAEKDDLITILSLDGSVVISADSVSKFEAFGNNEFYFRFQNSFQGVYSCGRSKWVIAPEQQGIELIRGIQSKARYCIRRAKLDSGWKFYSASGKLVSDLSLGRALSYMGSSNLVRIDGKYGIMTSNLEIILPNEYDYISEVRNSYYLKKNRQWHITSFPLSKISDGYTNISTHHYPQGRLVFKNGLIGAIDDNYEELIPLSSKEDFMNYDLANLLIPTEKPQVDQFPIVSLKNPAESKKINNRIILEQSRLFTTKNDVMPRAFQHNVDARYAKKLNDKERRKDETPSFLSKSYYSCKIYTSSKNWGVRDFNKKESTVYYNYEWKGDVLERIELADLFDSPYYVTHLDSLIIDYVNENQLYGISCVNLEQLLVTAKENFILSPEGIVLLAMERNRDTILIPYTEMRKFLKRPEEFID